MKKPSSYISLLTHFLNSVGLIGLPGEWRKRVDKGDMGGWKGGGSRDIDRSGKLIT